MTKAGGSMPALSAGNTTGTVADLVAIIERSSDAILTCDPTGRLLTWNRTAERLWGWGPAEVLGRAATELLFPGHLRSQVSELAQRVLAGETVEDVEIEARRRDGMLVPITLSCFPLVDETGRIRGGSLLARDISEQRLYQSTLAESEARLRDAEALAHAGMWLWDSASDTVQWSDELHRIHGLEPHQFDGTLSGHLAPILPEDRERVAAAMIAVLPIGADLEILYRITRPTGELRWVSARGAATMDSSSKAVGLRGICQDVTDVKRAEEALRRQASLLHLVQRIAVAANEAKTLEEALWSCLDEVSRHTDWPVGRATFGDAELWHMAEPDRFEWIRQAVKDRPSTLADHVRVRRMPVAGQNFAPGLIGVAVPVLVGSEVAAVLEFYCLKSSEPDDQLIDALLAGGIQLGRVVERGRAERALAEQALHDSLTGLPNRALFLNRLNHALSRGDRQRGLLAVLFLDLDGFKLVNDSLGHDVGDALLVAVAHRLRAVLRPGDTLARFGGDEFTILCDQLVEPEQALLVAQRLADALAEPIDLSGGGEVVVSTSIGVAFSGHPDDSADHLLRDADVAMYRAKEQGRARWEVFDVAMHTRAAHRLEVVKDLRRARELGQMTLAYQPQVAMDDGRIIGVEALLRWHHPQQGLVPPAEFIPLAEESQLVLPIGSWVIREACSQLAAWRRQIPGTADLEMCVNVSARQLASGDLASVVSAAIAENDLDPGKLCLEITESVLMEDAEFYLEVLLGLLRVGVRVAIDDFGIGYSSLAYLRRFPVDVLKLDRAFVEGIGTGAETSQARAIVRAVIEMAHSLDLTLVAEGIETADQAAALRRLGCDLGQGYWFARPQAPDTLIELLRGGGLALPPSARIAGLALREPAGS
jgi:diguanylate cyclase (GGDEF)-like protein/PAS domain S-box-containing protein